MPFEEDDTATDFDEKHFQLSIHLSGGIFRSEYTHQSLIFFLISSYFISPTHFVCVSSFLIISIFLMGFGFDFPLYFSFILI